MRIGTKQDYTYLGLSALTRLTQNEEGLVVAFARFDKGSFIPQNYLPPFIFPFLTVVWGIVRVELYCGYGNPWTSI